MLYGAERWQQLKLDKKNWQWRKWPCEVEYINTSFRIQITSTHFHRRTEYVNVVEVLHKKKKEWLATVHAWPTTGGPYHSWPENLSTENLDHLDSEGHNE